MSRDDEIADALRPTFAREAALLAAQIEEAAGAGRRGDVRALAHRLAGTAGTIRDDELVAVARELEELSANDVGVDVLAAGARSVAAAVRAAGVDVTAADGPEGRPAAAVGARPVVVATFRASGCSTSCAV